MLSLGGGGGGGEPSARVTWDCKFQSHPSLVVTSRGPCSATHGTCRPMPGAFVLPSPLPSPSPPARPCPPGPTPSGGNQEGQTVPAWCRPRGRETQGLRDVPPSLPLLSDPKVDMGTQQGSQAGSQAGAREVMLAPRRRFGGASATWPGLVVPPDQRQLASSLKVYPGGRARLWAWPGGGVAATRAVLLL